MTLDYSDERMLFLEILEVIQGDRVPRGANGHRLPYTKEDQANDIVLIFRAYLRKGSKHDDLRRMPTGDQTAHTQAPHPAIHAEGHVRDHLPQPAGAPGAAGPTGAPGVQSLAKRSGRGVE